MARHRGPAPRDRDLFAPDRLDPLRTAVAELSWLLARGYAEGSALKLVGDRHALTARQRKAVRHCACPDPARDARRRTRRPVEATAGETLHVDGFNVLIVGESVLGGGVVLVGRDGAHRDLASVHGTWRRVAETTEVVDALGAMTREAREVVWWLDRPVSNSGRLAALLRERARVRGWRWRTEVVWDPDGVLADTDGLVATADARVLDAGVRWVDLPGALARATPTAWVVDLR
ncbi:MAG TPA: DUF434 domain-containing protein [Sandaracinaceae bacterium LLY-WYZ-13_1]|nr:DUF434 domain-containing protein [Sandaracinaceae bacterium LLY-WYZ-13_1]